MSARAGILESKVGEHALHAGGEGPCGEIEKNLAVALKANDLDDIKNLMGDLKVCLKSSMVNKQNV